MATDTPEWLERAVIYEAFPRNHSADGTFAGLCRDLERIASLHTDILWLMPIHPIGAVGRKGTAGSPYAIRDYRAINPDLGDAESLEMLLAEAHKLGMRVIIDVVFNHTSRDSVLLAEHPEWFLRDAHGNATTKVPDWWDVYDLDYSHKGLWEYQIETLGKWVDMGVDGFRCDVASLVPLDFWITARKELARGRTKDLIWLAESVDKSFVKILRDNGWTAHSDPELHAAFDLTYDYDGFDYLKGYIQGTRPLRDYLNHLYIQETLYPAHAVKMRFIENHDNLRAAEVIEGRRSLLNWAIFYTLLPGATLVYAGQEIASPHRPDLFEKDPVDWEQGDYEFAQFMERALGLSKKIKGSCNQFSISELAEGVVKMVWRGDGPTYIALVNLAGKYGEVYLDELPENAVEICISRKGPVEAHARCLLSHMPMVFKISAPSRP
ncbi:MAG: alpha-amylase family glycosyl hydrolase [Firmicutes bacterium]|nr:alpha-amylase family glycosyl hydrolase [Bacillota bacterium]